MPICIIFLVGAQNNAKPHSSQVTRQKLIETLPDPPYSPDLFLTDYHFFPVLDANLRQKEFAETMHVENAIVDFIDFRNPEFDHDGIFSLPDRWRGCVDSNGFYFDK